MAFTYKMKQQYYPKCDLCHLYRVIQKFLYTVGLHCEDTTLREEGKWRGNGVASSPNRQTSAKQTLSRTLHTLQPDVNTSAAFSGLICLPLLKCMDSSIAPEDEKLFLRLCHHILIAMYVEEQTLEVESD
jgi:hypothetical protein